MGNNNSMYLSNMAMSLIDELKIKEIVDERDAASDILTQKLYEQSAGIVRECLRRRMRPKTWSKIFLSASEDELFYLPNFPCNISGEELALEFAVRAVISNMVLLFDMRNSEIIELLPEDEFIIDECVTEGNGFFDPSNLHIDEQ